MITPVEQTDATERTPAQSGIHPALGQQWLNEVLAVEHPLWTPDELCGLTRTVATELTEPLLKLLQFDAENRWWTRLALTEGVELWMLSWLPGQHTEPHDHGGASGSFTVLLGELAESLRYPKGSIREAVHRPNSSVGFGAGRAHQVHNERDFPAASVHAYSPPLVPTRQYRSLHDMPDVIPSLPPHRDFSTLDAGTARNQPPE